MSVSIERETIAKRPFAKAHINCAGCGSTSEPRTACGIGCADDAAAMARAHATIQQGWAPTFRNIREGKKTLSLMEYRCPSCQRKS